MAEYREMPMVSSALRRTLNSKKGLDRQRISKYYTLNTGHVTFFYDKGEFLHRRYQALIVELSLRGFVLDPERQSPDWELFHTNGLFGDYSPDASEVAINKDRIWCRYMAKPAWYKLNKNAIDSDRYRSLIDVE